MGDFLTIIRKNSAEANNVSRSVRGFTLTEMLMAVAILAVLVYSVNTLFSRTVKNVDVGDWKSKTQTRMRTATKQLAKDVARATYPSMITLSDTVIDKNAKWKLRYKDGLTNASSGGKMLEFYICTPGKNVPDEKTEQRIIKATAMFENTPEHTRLYLSKGVEKGPPPESADDTKKMLLLEDVSYIDMKVIKAEDATTYDTANRIKYFLKIEMQCIHPRYPKTIVTEVAEIPLIVDAASM